MTRLYKFKWPLIFFCTGLILEKLASMAAKEDYADGLWRVGLIVQILALIGLAWKLLFVEDK